MHQKQMSTIKFLQGEKVYLRPFEKEDVEALYTSLFDPEVRRLTGTQKVFSHLEIEQYLERISLDNNRVDLLIVLQEDDQTIGDIALNDLDLKNRSANIRVAINSQKNFGRGYGTEAMRLMLGYGFGVLNLHRIELDVFSFNERAIHTYEKLGFMKEGIKRDSLYYDYQYHDAIIMSILQDEFHANSSK
jgi:RimJ/RimL family protein N-acetyltransferase